MKKAIVIGSGAVGLCTAYYLQKEGVQVQVITASKEGEMDGCSFGNAGMIVPSHFTPLAAPGVITEGIKWLLDSKSPLYIKPRLNSDFISWMWKFIKSANANNVTKASPLLLELNQASRDLFENISQSEAIDFKFKKDGLMMLYTTSRYQDEEEHMAQKAASLGLDVEILDNASMRKHEDKLDADVLGGVWYKSDAHLVPQNFMNEMTALLQNKGVEISYDTRVTSFRKQHNEINCAETTKGDFEADEYIIAAGSWSQKIAKELNVSIPLEGGKGYHLHMENIPLQLNTPSILCEARVAVTPMESDLRVSGTMEFSGIDLSINKKRVEGIKESMSNYFTKFDKSWFDDTQTWAGLRPVSPDGLPYIGRSSSINNLSFNTGHAMMGLSLAPVSGKVLSDLLLKKSAEYSIDILSPDRFTS